MILAHHKSSPELIKISILQIYSFLCIFLSEVSELLCGGKLLIPMTTVLMTHLENLMALVFQSLGPCPSMSTVIVQCSVRFRRDACTYPISKNM